VQLFERPTLAGSRQLLRATATAFLSAVEARMIRRQDVIRDAQKRIMRLGALISFDAVAPEEMAQLTQSVIAEAIANASRQ
jgi:hypothetical protein